MTPGARPRRARRVPADADAIAAGDILLSRPGFLIRRLHQAHSQAFQAECAAFGVTPVQYSLLSVLAARAGIDQGTAATALGLDRFATADVIRRLHRAGMLRLAPGQDRRTRVLFLTPKGRRTHDAMDAPARRAHDDLAAILPPGQRALFLTLLRRLVDHHTRR